jgi:glycosyltransferase involved in cell wall biosynthesis
MERVSIITVSLNAVSRIETMLESVHSQTYPHIEHVVIDGGSTDGTLEVINKYRARINYFVSEPDRGVYNAMNKGIKAATGDIFFFLNADDRFCGSKVVEEVAAIFDQQPDVDIVYGNLIWEMPGKMLKGKQPPTVTREFLAARTILHQTIFARRGVFETTGEFTEHYKVVSDYEWMLKVFLRDKRKHIYYDRDIAVMGTGGRSWTTNWEKERIEVMRKYFSLPEIFKYRIWPKKKIALENSIRIKKNSIRQAMHRLEGFVWKGE